jgi:hypothetical protein
MNAVRRQTRRSAIRARLLQSYVQTKINQFAQFMEAERLAGHVDANLHAIANALDIAPEVFIADLNRIGYSEAKSEPAADHFICALCKEEFVAARPDEEARAECKELFGHDPANGDCAVICSVCFEKVSAVYPPAQFLLEELEDASEC